MGCRNRGWSIRTAVNGYVRSVSIGDTVHASRRHEYTDEMDEALEIDHVAEKLERGEIDGRAVITPA